MCFSETISFGAAAVLAAQGVLSVRAAPARRYVPIAAVPLLFAVQQLCEGLLWREIANAPFNKVTSPSGYAFVFFAFAIWPGYLPAALALLERGQRRRWLIAMSAAGLTAGAYLLACVTFRATDVCLAHGNLYYWVQVDHPIKPLAPLVYLAIVVAPLLIASLSGIRLLGVALTVSFTLSALLGRAGFLSIWCFSAAVLSGFICFIMHSERRRSSVSAIGSRATA